MEEKKHCLYCNEEIAQGDEVAECNYCKGLYHRHCREESMSCVVPGCFASTIPCEDKGFESMIRSEDYYSQASEIYVGFYGDDDEYYSEKFKNMSTVSWNWAACFFGYIWFAYRKMYGYALIFGAFHIAFKMIEIAAPELMPITALFSLIMQLVTGLFGNVLYYYRVRKLSAMAKTMEKDVREKFIDKNGGSSAVNVFICFVIYCVIVFSFKLLIDGSLA